MEGGISADLRGLALELQMVDRAYAAAIRRRIRAAVVEGGEEILAAAKANASWSTRIPDATSLRTAITARSAGVTMRTDQRKAPHARPLERGSKGGGGVNRHPVFAPVGSAARDNPNRWVNQPTRPFFFKAVDEAGPAVEAQIIAAVDQAVRDAGFR